MGGENEIGEEKSFGEDTSEEKVDAGETCGNGDEGGDPSLPSLDMISKTTAKNNKKQKRGYAFFKIIL